MKSDRLRFLKRYPHSSCLTATNVKYLLGNSRSITFNEEKFNKESNYLGVHVKAPKRFIDKAIGVFGLTSHKQDKEDAWNFKIGNSDVNYEPKYHISSEQVLGSCHSLSRKYQNKTSFFFTLKALFMGRGYDLEYELSLVSNFKCICCDKEHEPESFMYGEDGRIRDMGDRYEYTCKECYSAVVSVNREKTMIAILKRRVELDTLRSVA